MMAATLVFLVVLMNAVLLGATVVAPVVNVRVLHTSPTEVRLHWDWQPPSGKSTLFALDYKIDEASTFMYLRDSSASLMVRPGGVYRVTVEAMVYDSGTWLWSDPAVVTVEALPGDWPVPTAISCEPIMDDDEKMLYSISWHQEDPKDLSSFKIQICEGTHCKEIRTKFTAVNHSFKCNTMYTVQIFVEYRSHLDDGTTVETTRKSEKFPLFTESGAPSEVRNLHLAVVNRGGGLLSEGGQYVEMTWESPEFKRGPLPGYRVRLSNGRLTTEPMVSEMKFLMPAPECGRNYEVEVSAFNYALNGSYHLGPPEKSGITTPPCEQTEIISVWIAASLLTSLIILSLIVLVKLYSRYSGEPVRFEYLTDLIGPKAERV